MIKKITDPFLHLTSLFFLISFSAAKEQKTLTSFSRVPNPFSPLRTSWSLPTSTRASSLAFPTSTLSSSIHPCTVWYEERENGDFKEGKPHKKRMTVTVYRFLPVSTKHPAVNRLDSSSAVLRLLAINTRIEKWPRREEQSVKTIYVQSKENRFPKHLTVCSFILTLCLFFQTRSLYLVNKCVSVSVTL